MPAPQMQIYAAREFAYRLGFDPEDWNLDLAEKVRVMPSDQVYVGDAFLGKLTQSQREALELEPSSLEVINAYRESTGLPLLDPYREQWSGEDLEIEAANLQRVANMAASAWPALGAFGGRFVGGWGMTWLGGRVFGTNEPLGILNPPVYASRVVGQVLGAAGVAALAAPRGRRTRAALGGAAGAWVPYVGAPLAALGAYFATKSGRKSNPIRPRAKRWIWIAAGVATLLVGGGVAYAKMRKRSSGPPSPEDAVDRAIEILGSDASAIEVADAAYPMAYPDCPEKLDPDDPDHALCIEDWNHLYDLAKDTLPKGKWGPRPVPDDLPDEGPAADMRAWLGSLSPHQRTELRRIIGPKYYDPIKRAANAGDDGKTVGNVLRLKNAIEKLLREDPIEAASQYNELKKLLGPKLDDLMDAAEKYEGDA